MAGTTAVKNYLNAMDSLFPVEEGKDLLKGSVSNTLSSFTLEDSGVVSTHNTSTDVLVNPQSTSYTITIPTTTIPSTSAPPSAPSPHTVGTISSNVGSFTITPQKGNYIYVNGDSDKGTELKVNNEPADIELLKDIKKEFEGKLEDITADIEDLVKQMKEHPEGISVFNNAFQFNAGQKALVKELINKLDIFLKEYAEKK